MRGSVSGLRCARWFGEGEYAVTESVKGSNHNPERKVTPYFSLVATDVQSEFIEKSRVALHFFGFVRKEIVKLRSCWEFDFAPPQTPDVQHRQRPAVGS